MAKLQRYAVDLELEGWESFGRVLNSNKLISRLATKLRTQNQTLSVKGASLLRRSINGHFVNWPANSAWTIAKKGSSKPLIDHGDLLGNVSSKVIYMGFIVGTKRVTDDNKNLAWILHEGATISHPKNKSVKLVIPPRPYLKVALVDNISFALEVTDSWKIALHQAITSISKPDKVF